MEEILNSIRKTISELEEEKPGSNDNLIDKEISILEAMIAEIEREWQT